jgi:hypothetical protein
MIVQITINLTVWNYEIMCQFMLVLSIKQNVLLKFSSVCNASLILVLIFIYIPKIQKLLQTLDIERGRAVA